MLKNTFYFILKALFVLEIFKFLFRTFGYVGKRLDKKAKVNFKIYDDIAKCITSNYDTNIARYPKK